MIIDHETIVTGLTRLHGLRRLIDEAVEERRIVIQDLRLNGATIADLHRATGLAPDTIRRLIGR